MSESADLQAVLPAGPTDVVLVVDDEPHIRDLMKDFLERSIGGLLVRTAESGGAGLQILAIERVDLIVTDYKMPGMDGIEFMECARQVAPSVPRILLTAYPDPDLTSRAVRDAGAEFFLTKPVDRALLVAVVGGALQERRALEDVRRTFWRTLDLLGGP